MITRYIPGGPTLADREALAILLNRPAATIRARCRPIAHDTDTRRALYDADQVAQTMAGRRRVHQPYHRLAGA